MSGLQVIAEDQPQPSNRVEVDWSTTDRWGLPRLRIHHDYTRRDLAARAELVRRAKQVLREAHALPLLYTYKVGTVRMGTDQKTSALDEHCRFRGVENLFVTDGSFMPTSGGVNPSLTIAANALRVGAHIASPQPG
jgi:choline dehydrogenase-like flavoprotein